VDVVKIPFLKKPVNSERHFAAHAKDASEQIGARAQMSDFTKKLDGVSLFLQWVVAWAGSNDFDGMCLNLPLLSLALGFHECALHTDGSSGADLFDFCIVGKITLSNNLQVFEA